MIHRIVSCIEYLCFRRIKRYIERELQTKTRGGKEKLFGFIFIPLKQHKNHKTFYYVFYLFFSFDVFHKPNTPTRKNKYN